MQIVTCHSFNIDGTFFNVTSLDVSLQSDLSEIAFQHLNKLGAQYE